MKKLSIIFFGQLTELTGTTELALEAFDLNQLIQQLYSRFPKLKETKFTVAVNNVMVNGNADLNDNSTIALMPPFSGG